MLNYSNRTYIGDNRAYAFGKYSNRTVFATNLDN